MPKTLLLLVAAICPVMLFSAGPNRCPAAEKPSAEQRIEEELGKPTELKFIETPLQHVVNYLKKRHRIEIQIDRKGLDDVGLDSSTALITKHLKGLSLGSTLRLLLRDMDLTYVIQNEVLLITTPEEAETRLTTRVYPVGDLTGSFRLPPELPLFSLGIPVVGTWSEQARPPRDSERTATTEADPPPESAAEPTRALPRVGTLADMVSSIVEPTSWEEVGGPGSIAAIGSVGGVDVLVVSQTQEVHEQILDLLDTLREAVRCSRSAAAPAPKPAAGKPTTEEPPKAPPPPEPDDPFGD